MLNKEKTNITPQFVKSDEFQDEMLMKRDCQKKKF